MKAGMIRKFYSWLRTCLNSCNIEIKKLGIVIILWRLGMKLLTLKLCRIFFNWNLSLSRIRHMKSSSSPSHPRAKQLISTGSVEIQQIAELTLPWVGRKTSWLNSDSKATTESLALKGKSSKQRKWVEYSRIDRSAKGRVICYHSMMML